MSKLSTAMFLVVALAALGAVGVTTTLMTTQTVQAGGQCHENQGSFGCTGSGGGFICNKKHPIYPIDCVQTGKP